MICRKFCETFCIFYTLLHLTLIPVLLSLLSSINAQISYILHPSKAEEIMPKKQDKAKTHENQVSPQTLDKKFTQHFHNLNV